MNATVAPLLKAKKKAAKAALCDTFSIPDSAAA
jgi:hypothetical protein